MINSDFPAKVEVKLPGKRWGEPPGCEGCSFFLRNSLGILFSSSRRGLSAALGQKLLGRGFLQLLPSRTEGLLPFFLCSWGPLSLTVIWEEAPAMPKSRGRMSGDHPSCSYGPVEGRDAPG